VGQEGPLAGWVSMAAHEPTQVIQVELNLEGGLRFPDQNQLQMCG
jgi:hypothetical protein